MFALYGDLNAIDNSKRVDVTQKIKDAFAGKASLTLSTTKKAELFRGIADPAPGVNKGLVIVYCSRSGYNVSAHFSAYNQTTTIPSTTDFSMPQLFPPVNHAGMTKIDIYGAIYGDLNTSGTTGKQDKAQKANTTLVVGANIDASMCVPPNPSFTNMQTLTKVGVFGDPAPGKAKGLFVIGQWLGKLYVGCYGDQQGGQLGPKATPIKAYQYSIGGIEDHYIR
jgi:hypothetical protein